MSSCWHIFQFFLYKMWLKDRRFVQMEIWTDVSTLSLWIKPLLFFHQSLAALILPFEKNSTVAADLLLQPVIQFLSSVYFYHPYIPRLLISVFFIFFHLSLNCCMSSCHQQQWGMAMSVLGFFFFFSFAWKKGGSFFFLSQDQTHCITCTNANMKWQSLDWTVEWLSKAPQLGKRVFQYENPDVLMAQRSWCTWNSNEGEMQKQKFLGRP